VLLLTIPSRFLHEPVFHERFSALLVLIWNFAAQKMYVKSSSRGDSAAAAASVGLDIPLGPSSDPMARSKKSCALPRWRRKPSGSCDVTTSRDLVTSGEGGERKGVVVVFLDDEDGHPRFI